MKSEEHKTTDIYNDYLNKAFEDMSIGHSMNTNLYKDSFKEIVRQKSVDKNVDPNSINYIFQTYALDISYTPPDCLDNLYGKFYPHIEKCMGNQGNIHQLRIGIINRANDGVTDIQRFKDALNKCNTVEIERLKMERNQLITLYVNKCVMHQAYQDFVKLCEQSGESFEGNEVLLEIKDLQEKLKEKIDQKLDNHNFDEQTKSYALQLFNSQQHLKKLQYIEQSIKPINDDLLTCGISSNIFFDLTNFQKFESLVNSLNQKKQEITNWKNRSDSLTEEIINTVIEFAQEKTSTTLEIKSIGENLEETINKGLADKNIDEEVKNQVWQMPFYSSKYKEVLDKLETHKQLVKTCENKILNCDTFVSANSLNMELKKIHKDRIEELNFYTNQVVKHFVTKALQISGKPLEETSMMSDIKNLPNEFNEKINKNFEDNLIINEKVKSAVDKLFHSKCVEHLKNLELIEKSVKKYEHELLMCNDFKESKKIVASLNQKQKEFLCIFQFYHVLIYVRG